MTAAGALRVPDRFPYSLPCRLRQGFPEGSSVADFAIAYIYPIFPRQDNRSFQTWPGEPGFTKECHHDVRIPVSPRRMDTSINRGWAETDRTSLVHDSAALTFTKVDKVGI